MAMTTLYPHLWRDYETFDARDPAHLAAAKELYKDTRHIWMCGGATAAAADAGAWKTVIREYAHVHMTAHGMQAW